jgi:hypothetical protein
MCLTGKLASTRRGRQTETLLEAVIGVNLADDLRGAHVTASRPDLESRFLGCLLGCAVGDALGAPFEGYWGSQLPDRGNVARGICGF